MIAILQLIFLAFLAWNAWVGVRLLKDLNRTNELRKEVADALRGIKTIQLDEE